MTTRVILLTDILSQTGHTFTTDEQSLIIRLIESKIASDIRINEMRVTDGAFVINARSVARPTRFVEVKRFRLTSTGGTLDYMTPDVFYDSPIYQDETGAPEAYTIEGDNFIFAPEPTTSYTGLLSYLKAFDPLTADSDTNWLLTNRYNIYFSLGMSVGFGLAQDDEQASKWLAVYTGDKDKLNTSNQWSTVQANELRRFGNVSV